jgi:hypothetical protein
MNSTPEWAAGPLTDCPVCGYPIPPNAVWCSFCAAVVFLVQGATNPLAPRGT